MLPLVVVSYIKVNTNSTSKYAIKYELPKDSLDAFGNSYSADIKKSCDNKLHKQ